VTWSPLMPMPEDERGIQLQIAILLAEAERQRNVLGDIIDDYRQITAPVDRLYQRVTDFVRGRPLATTVTLGLGAFAWLQIRRRLPSLPLRNLIRGGSVAVAVIRLLRKS